MSNPNISYGTTTVQQAVGDPIASLPTDESPPSEDDLRLVNTLFKKNSTFLDKMAIECKDLFIIGVLFIVFSLPFTDRLVSKIPIAAKSPYILLGIKTLLVMILFWIIKHFHLSRK
jgi:hypothetical protein